MSEILRVLVTWACRLSTTDHTATCAMARPLRSGSFFGTLTVSLRRPWLSVALTIESGCCPGKVTRACASAFGLAVIEMDAVVPGHTLRAAVVTRLRGPATA